MSEHTHKRGPWSQHEDHMLLRLVTLHGPQDWVNIAKEIKSRKAKQCRERYYQNLKPDLNHDPITEEEGRNIERMVHEMGPKWAEIARHIPGRSDNAVKNWWNGGLNRRKRDQERNGDGSGSSKRRKVSDPTSHIPARGSGSSSRFNRTIIVPPLSQRVDRPMASPMSDKTPSLVSDHGSRFSQSPRVEPSPSIEHELNPFSRRNSRPNFSISTHHVPAYGIPSSTSVSPMENRLPSIGYQHKTSSSMDSTHRPDVTAPPADTPYYMSLTRHTPPQVETRLPSIHSALQSPALDFMRLPATFDLSARSPARSDAFTFRFDESARRRSLGHLPSLMDSSRPAPPLFSPTRSETGRPSYTYQVSRTSPTTPSTGRPNGGLPALSEASHLEAEGPLRDTRMKLANLLS